MARKFSKQSEKALAIAVNRYNSMRTRYIKSGGKTVAPRVSTKELKAEAENTQALRQIIKRLNDYKKVADFETEKVQGYKFATTKGERRTIARLDKAMRAVYKKEIKKLEAQKTTASGPELINKIIPGIQELKTKPTVISQIPSRKYLERARERYEREQRSYKKYGELEPPTVTLDHYLAAFLAVGLENVPGGANVYYRLANMTADEWAEFVENNEGLADIDGYMYDVGVSGAEKVNAISAALGMDIDSSMLL